MGLCGALYVFHSGKYVSGNISVPSDFPQAHTGAAVTCSVLLAKATFYPDCGTLFHVLRYVEVKNYSSIGPFSSGRLLFAKLEDNCFFSFSILRRQSEQCFFPLILGLLSHTEPFLCLYLAKWEREQLNGKMKCVWEGHRECVNASWRQSGWKVCFLPPLRTE